MAVMLAVLVHTVLPFVPLDGDHKVDGELNAEQITHGHIQDSLLASLVLMYPVN